MVEATYKNCSLEEFVKMFCPEGWEEFFKDEVKEEIRLIEKKLKVYKDLKIFPEMKDIFKAFELCPLNKVKVIILGQDPYHSESKLAMGLAFSVPNDMTCPPSLQNIKKELKDDLQVEEDFELKDLSFWAKQGVLLLNTSLTVKANSPGSHLEIWKNFTDLLLSFIIEKRGHQLVFILWGNHAKAFKARLPYSKIKGSISNIITSTHPSPYSAMYGFFGSKPFSKCNAYLKEVGLEPINWVPVNEEFIG